MGKTTLIQNLVRQEIERGSGCAFIDPHGDAAPELLAYVPERRVRDIVYLDFTEASPPVAFNPLAASAEQRTGMVEDFLSYFSRFFEADATNAPRMMHILRFALLTLVQSRSPKSLADLPRILLENEFRGQVLGEIADPDLRKFWELEFPGLRSGAALQPILSRLSAVLAPGSQLRRLLSQRENRIDFRQIMNERKVLLARLSKGRGLEMATHFLGALLVTKIQQEALDRVNLPLPEREPFHLYVDEFHNYTVSSFETILAESAKYRLGIVMANQTFHSLPATLRTAIIGNVGTFAAFRLGSEDAPVIQREIRKRVVRERTSTGQPTTEEVWYPSVEDFQNLRPHQAFVRLGRPEVVEAVSTLPLPPPPADGSDIRHEVIAWSRRQYHGREGKGPTTPQAGQPKKPDNFLE